MWHINSATDHPDTLVSLQLIKKKDDVMMTTQILIQHFGRLVNFRSAAVVNRSVSFQRCPTLDLIHQRFVTYPWVGQRFTVDEASHSEGLPRKSLLG